MTMTVREVVDQWDTMDTDSLNTIGRGLLRECTPLTLGTIQNFQAEWDPSKGSYEDFRKAQKDVVEQCVEMEISDVGRAVRETLNREPLTWETEIGDQKDDNPGSTP